MRQIKWIIVLFWCPIALSSDCYSSFKDLSNYSNPHSRRGPIIDKNKTEIPAIQKTALPLDKMSVSELIQLFIDRSERESVKLSYRERQELKLKGSFVSREGSSGEQTGAFSVNGQTRPYQNGDKDILSRIKQLSFGSKLSQEALDKIKSLLFSEWSNILTKRELLPLVVEQEVRFDFDFLLDLFETTNPYDDTLLKFDILFQIRSALSSDLILSNRENPHHVSPLSENIKNRLRFLLDNSRLLKYHPAIENILRQDHKLSSLIEKAKREYNKAIEQKKIEELSYYSLPYAEDNSYEEKILALKELIKKKPDSLFLYKTLVSILSDPDIDETELYTMAWEQFSHISLKTDQNTISGLLDLLMDTSLTYTKDTVKLLATFILLAPDENFKNTKTVFKYLGKKRGLAGVFFLRLKLWLKKSILLSAQKEMQGWKNVSHSSESYKFVSFFYSIIEIMSSAEHDKVRKNRVYQVLQYYSLYEDYLKKNNKNKL